jgi:putative pyruvate formate lyase activating enzyme
VGRGGSGTIFFTYCNLGCVFCQNYDISHLGSGEEISTRRLGEAMLELQQIGCHNINFVTPTHFVPQILDALPLAIEAGLSLPLVYNSGGYDSVETLRLLDGIFDIYMPDFKYSDRKVSARFSNAPDYPKTAKTALREMHRQVGELQLDERGIARRGLLIRHLVLPEDLAGTKEAMQFIAQQISPQTYVNVMEQYRPCYQASEHPPLDRPITGREFREAVEMALQEGLNRLEGLS